MQSALPRQAHKRHEAAGRAPPRLGSGTLGSITRWCSRLIGCYQSEIGWVWFFKMTFCLSEFEVSCLAARCYDWRIRFVPVFVLFGNFTVSQENGKNPRYEVFQKSTTQKFIVMRLCNFLYRNICTYRVFSKAVLDEPLLWFSCYEGMCACMHAIRTYICTYMHT